VRNFKNPRGGSASASQIKSRISGDLTPAENPFGETAEAGNEISRLTVLGKKKGLRLNAQALEIQNG